MSEFLYARRAFAAQARLLRCNWVLDHEGINDTYRQACGAEAARFIDAFAHCPYIESMRVKADAEIQREDGQIFLLFQINPVATVRIGAAQLEVDFLDPKLSEKDIDDLCRQLPDMRRSEVEYAVAEVNQQIFDFQGVGSLTGTGEAFWSKHNDFTITREMVSRAISTDPIDYAHALNAIFGWGEPVDFDCSRPPHRWSPVTLSRIDQYLAGGVSPDACDAFGVTALNAAVGYGRHPWMHPLMRAGADLDLADATGLNPVSTAVTRGDQGLLEVLVRAGANPNGSRFAPSIALASIRSDANELIAKLVALGADTGQRLPDGTRLSDDFDRVSPEPVRRELASLHTQRTIESAFDGSAEARPAASRSGGMTL